MGLDFTQIIGKHLFEYEHSLRKAAIQLLNDRRINTLGGGEGEGDYIFFGGGEMRCQWHACSRQTCRLCLFHSKSRHLRYVL